MLLDEQERASFSSKGYWKIRPSQKKEDQGQLQCKNGKAAHNRQPVAPANGEPSQPCQPQDVCGNGTLEGCSKADVLVREFPRRVWADLENGEAIGDKRRTPGEGRKH